MGQKSSQFSAEELNDYQVISKHQFISCRYLVSIQAIKETQLVL